MPHALPAADATIKQAVAVDCSLSCRDLDVLVGAQPPNRTVATAPQLKLKLRQAVLRRCSVNAQPRITEALRDEPEEASTTLQADHQPHSNRRSIP